MDSVNVFGGYVIEYLKDRLRFEKSGEYGNGTFDEIRERVYDNQELMTELYLPGLFLANVFAPLLHEKYKLFERSFVSRLDASMTGAEIGFGDGFHLWTVMKDVSGSRVQGFDISAHATRFSTRLFDF